MNNPIFLCWLAILVALVVIELFTTSLTTIWFAGGAFIAAILALFDTPLWVQIAIALVVSIILLIFTRPIAMKHFNTDREKTNVEGLIGKKAIVLSEINNIQGVGTVKVGGQEWSARSFDESVIIAKDTYVEVVEISGVKLVVKASGDKEEV